MLNLFHRLCSHRRCFFKRVLCLLLCLLFVCGSFGCSPSKDILQFSQAYGYVASPLQTVNQITLYMYCATRNDISKEISDIHLQLNQPLLNIDYFFIERDPALSSAQYDCYRLHLLYTGLFYGFASADEIVINLKDGRQFIRSIGQWTFEIGEKPLQEFQQAAGFVAHSEDASCFPYLYNTVSGLSLRSIQVGNAAPVPEADLVMGQPGQIPLSHSYAAYYIRPLLTYSSETTSQILYADPCTGGDFSYQKSVRKN